MPFNWKSVDDAMLDPGAGITMASSSDPTTPIYLVVHVQTGMASPQLSDGTTGELQPVVTFTGVEAKDFAGPATSPEALRQVAMVFIDPTDFGELSWQTMAAVSCPHVAGELLKQIKIFREQGHTCEHFPEGIPEWHSQERMDLPEGNRRNPEED